MSRRWVEIGYVSTDRGQTWGVQYPGGDRIWERRPEFLTPVVRVPAESVPAWARERLEPNMRAAREELARLT